MRVVLPEPRKPVRMVMGMGAIVYGADQLEGLCTEKWTSIQIVAGEAYVRGYCRACMWLLVRPGVEYLGLRLLNVRDEVTSSHPAAPTE